MLWKRLVGALAVLFVGAVGSAGVAQAAPECWITGHRTLLSLNDCVSRAVSVLGQVAGSPAGSFSVDSTTVWIYAFSPNDTLMAVCSESPEVDCSVTMADISISACSSVGNGDSASMVSWANSLFGNTSSALDCGSRNIPH